MEQEDIEKTLGNVSKVENFDAQIDSKYLPKVLVTDPVAKLLKLSHGDVISVEGQFYYIF